MKHCVLFLHGHYRKADLGFYKKLCRSKTRMAVDGGMSFFRKAGMEPDMLIGDLDSAGRYTGRLSSKTRILTFPRRKDKTDSQLAVEYLIEQGATNIDMVVPAPGQPDHFAANLLLPTLAPVFAWAKRGGRFKIISRAYEVAYVVDGEISFSGCIGHIVSLTPLSKQIILSCKGTEYDVCRARIPRGHTRALRNRIAARRAVFTVKGEALVWHLFR